MRRSTQYSSGWHRLDVSGTTVLVPLHRIDHAVRLLCATKLVRSSERLNATETRATTDLNGWPSVGRQDLLEDADGLVVAHENVELVEAGSSGSTRLVASDRRDLAFPS